MTTYIAEKSYLAIIPEVTDGTPLVPTNFVPLVSESIKTVVNHMVDRRMKGVDWKGNGLLRGNRSHEGQVVVLGDPDTMGHILNMVMAKGNTTGSADGYTHPFTVGDAKSYTFEIKKGNYTQRYFGVRIDQTTLEFVNQQLQVTFTIKAKGQFGIGSVGVALTGAGMTVLTLDDEYDINPNQGLVAGDVITVGGVDVTLLTVSSNGRDVTFASTAITAAVGLPVLLKPQTVSMATLQDPFYLGNIVVGVGADSTAATTASGARTTASPVYDLKIIINNNLFAQNGTSRMDPVQIIPTTKEAQVELKQLFTGVAQRQAWMDRTKQAITLVFWGKYIKNDFSTQEKMTIKFNQVKLIDNLNEIKVGSLIVDDQKFEAVYDNTDGKAMTIDLINRTAGTSY